jgi:hypothetical protein
MHKRKFFLNPIIEESLASIRIYIIAFVIVRSSPETKKPMQNDILYTIWIKKLS